MLLGVQEMWMKFTEKRSAIDRGMTINERETFKLNVTASEGEIKYWKFTTRHILVLEMSVNSPPH